MHHGLATALNILTERRQPVRAGMVFATGAITGIHEIRPGQHCRIEVRGGPSVELRTTDLARRADPFAVGAVRLVRRNLTGVSAAERSAAGSR